MFELTPATKQRAQSNPVPASPRMPGVFSMARKTLEAFCEERTAAAETRIIAARQALTQARYDSITAELTARLEAASLAAQVETEMIESDFWQRVRTAGSRAAMPFIEDGVAMEAALAERAGIRQLRLQGARYERNATAERPPTDSGAEIQPHVSADTAEKLALKAIAKFGSLTGAAADEAWATWAEEVRKRFPEFTARTIENRAHELRQLTQED